MKPQEILGVGVFSPVSTHALQCQAFTRGRTNRVFGKPCLCPLPKTGRFDENGENDEFAFYPLKTRVWLLRPPESETKTTKMAGVTQEKAWLRKGRVCSSLTLHPKLRLFGLRKRDENDENHSGKGMA